MKTTVELSDAILSEVKAKAREKQVTKGNGVCEGIEEGKWRDIRVALGNSLACGTRIISNRNTSSNLLAADRDFSRFPGLNVKNPLVS